MKLSIVDNRTYQSVLELKTLSTSILQDFLNKNKQYPQLPFPENSFDLGNMESKNYCYTTRLNVFE